MKIFWRLCDDSKRKVLLQRNTRQIHVPSHARFSKRTRECVRIKTGSENHLRDERMWEERDPLGSRRQTERLPSSCIPKQVSWYQVFCVQNGPVSPLSVYISHLTCAHTNCDSFRREMLRLFNSEILSHAFFCLYFRLVLFYFNFLRGLNVTVRPSKTRDLFSF